MTTCKVEQSSFLVLKTKSDWEQGLSLNLDISDDGIRLKKTFQYAFEREIELEQITPGFQITDFAIGECSQIYLLDSPSRAIWVYDPNQNRFEQIDCIAPLFTRPTAIAFVPGTLFISDAEAEMRVLGLAQINQQIRWAASESRDGVGRRLELAAPFEPADLATDDEGNLYALDRANMVIVQFDRTGRLQGSFGNAQLAGKTPVAIAFYKDAGIYVLELKERQILRLRPGDGSGDGTFINFAELIAKGFLPAAFSPFGLAVDAKGTLYVGDHREEPSKDEEDDRFIRKFRPQAEMPEKGEYDGEVSAFRGSVESLAVDRADRIYIFSRPDQLDKPGKKNQITILKLEEKYAGRGASPLVKGSYISRSLDSTEAGMIWHKLLLDASIGDNTQIQLSHLTADEKLFIIEGQGGQPQDLDLFIDQSNALGDLDREARIERLGKLDWSDGLRDPKDALIINAPGRYLWLKIELIGSEKQTPTLSAARADFPRTSYLRYLPGIYQEDEGSRDFLERFLSLFETFFANLEDQITHVVRYFDADASVTQGPFLRWLAGWFAIAADNNWDDERLRALIRRVPSLYKKRGTREGLEEMIELYTGSKPIIVESFQWKRCLQGFEAIKPARKPPSRRCASVIRSADGDPLVRFERTVPAYMDKGEVGKIKVVVTPLADIESIRVQETLSATLQLKSGALNLTRQKSEITAAGGIMPLEYEVAASENGGIKGTIKITPAGRDSEEFATVNSTLMVRLDFAELLARLYGTDPYCFCVLLGPAQVKSESERAAVRRLVEAEKPAHTCAGVRSLQPWIQLDLHTYLGVNARLSRPSFRLDFGSSVPRDTVLNDVEETGQLEKHSRLGIDTTVG